MINIQPIAICHSPYRQKFAIPRQPRLVKQARARIEFLPAFNRLEAVQGLEQFSHLWLLFIFDQNLDEGWRMTTRPPRLGGQKKMGVFATRSTHRPNPIGQSAVELLDIHYKNKQLWLEVAGIDLLDQTPIVDIKPYLPYADHIADADAGIATEKPIQKPVQWSVRAEQQLQQHCLGTDYPWQEIYSLVTSMLAQDPRPAFKLKRPDSKRYRVQVYRFDFEWCLIDESIQVLQVIPLDSEA
jgi:tRNA (adenine37-N6)-methyltransferase